MYLDKDQEEEVQNSVQQETGEITWIDREFSWLDFNHRVLEQCKRTDIPATKRLTFIGIAANNLNEFISVRYAQVFSRGEKEYKNKLRDKILSHKREIESCYEEMNKKYHICEYSIPEETAEGGDKEYSKLYSVFRKAIYPVLTPIMVAKNKEIPRMNERDVNFFIKLGYTDDESDDKYCFMQVPHQIPRVYEIKGKKYLIEDIISAFIDEIFNSVKVKEYVLFTVNKNYSEDITIDGSGLAIDQVANAVTRRERNNFIHIDVMNYNFNSDDTKIIKILYKLLHVNKNNLYVTKKNNNNAIGLHFLTGADIEIKEDLEYIKSTYNTNFKPSIPLDLDQDKMFDILDDEDIVLHHPYDSYDLVIRFLKEAANDSKVISIKQTLYRVSSDKSPIVKALADAARKGIQVTVMIELLARFDERRNISLINKLKSAGVNIVYSLEGLKTHCKMCLVVKATKRGMKTYAHMSTGNYNEKTACVYTDISYFTSKSSIGHDLNSLFNMITGISRPGNNMKAISYSPDTLRPKLMEEIKWVCEAPFEENDENKTRRICIKVNAISDEEFVKFILQMAAAHPDVNFNIICRGICSLPSRENILIKSIVGRFLEHSRIYMFEHGGDKKVFISSADLLTRNLDRRIESLVEIDNKSVRKKISKIFESMWEDTANSYVLTGDSWEKVNSEPYINCQNNFTL